MLDRIIEEVLSSFYSWSVDRGMMGSGSNRDNSRITQPPQATAQRKMSSVTNNTSDSETAPPPNNSQPSIEDPEYFQRVMQSRYPEHMLHCPQTSLYPIFFFLMERWEQRRAASQQQTVLPTPTEAKSD